MLMLLLILAQLNLLIQHFPRVLLRLISAHIQTDESLLGLIFKILLLLFRFIMNFL
jgi:hypothetical protein